MLPRGDSMRPFMIITDSLVEIPPKIQTRNVVRAVAFKDNQILLMFSEHYKMFGTPGGGAILDEGLLETLKRELQEETGAKKAKIIAYIGNVEEIRESMSIPGQAIRIISDYYQVEILEFTTPNLEEYEEEIGLVPMWVDIDEAIKQNTTQIKSADDKKITFYHTQTEVLKYLKNRFEI